MTPFELPPPRGELIWAAVDLDGTLAEPVWTPKTPGPEIGDPIWDNVGKLWGLVRSGYKVVIHTSRGWHDYEAIESWLNYWFIPHDKIVCGKLLAKVYIDDRALHESADSWVV